MDIILYKTSILHLINVNPQHYLFKKDTITKNNVTLVNHLEITSTLCPKQKQRELSVTVLFQFTVKVKMLCDIAQFVFNTQQ